MDHSESIRLMAAEKYLLGELAPELREQFEEHFFDCQECALDVRAGAALVARPANRIKLIITRCFFIASLPQF